MQVLLHAMQGPRAQRDGPSLAQQAQDALIQEYQAELAATSERIRALMDGGATRTAEGRAALARERQEMSETAGKLRAVESQQREDALEAAAQAMAARSLGAREGTTAVPPRRDFPDRIPPAAVEISIAFFITMGAAIVLFPLMRSLGRVLERRAAPPQRLAPEIEGQLQRMEQAIDTVAIEVERLAEGQRFTARLLSEKEKAGKLRG